MGETGIEEWPCKDRAQGRQERRPLLAHRRNITPDPTEMLRALWGAETTRHFLLRRLEEAEHFTQMMGIAQRLPTGITGVLISGIPVMHTYSLKTGQDRDLGQGLAAPVAAVGIQGQGRSASHMDPVQVARHAHTGLIEVAHGARSDRGFERRFDGSQRVVRRPNGRQERALAGRVAQQVGEHLGGARQWQQLILVQIDAEGQDFGAILRGLGHVGGKRAQRAGLAVRADTRQALVLGHVQRERRKVEDLALLRKDAWHFQKRGATGTAGGGRMRQGLVGSVAPLERMAAMPWLASGGFAGLLAQVNRRRFLLEAIA